MLWQRALGSLEGTAKSTGSWF